jgi:hypothetical protein
MKLFSKKEVLDCWVRFSNAQRIVLLRILHPEEQQWVWDYVDATTGMMWWTK